MLKEIRQDVGSGRQMNRLLQGDVGSGKTLVALMSMLMALDNGYQACMMAPTEILANQHYETIKELLFGMDIRVELLTGSVKGKKREAILSGLLTGYPDRYSCRHRGYCQFFFPRFCRYRRTASFWGGTTCPPME